MAKKEKAAKADTKGSKAKAAEKEEAAPEFKYGVQDIADALDLKPASVRVQLRNKGIEKAGKSYGWNSKSELKEVIDQLKAKASDDDEDEKPAKKSKDKGDKKAKAGKDEKPAKKAKTKKSKADEDDDDDD